MKKLLSSLFILTLLGSVSAQRSYWQQHVAYTMNVDFNVQSHQFKGIQNLVYTNNSPDTLKRAYYHLYFNAFQPGSSMDVRSRALPDPDPRVGSRIAALKPEEIGFQKVKSLKQDGQALVYEINETILEVQLAKPIAPGQTVRFDMEFEAQVPIQIRRSGRNSAEGIDYSVTQWYPKMCEYDADGWHPNPYIAREFYGIWGSYDVKIKMDSAYTIAATGYLQNADEIGKGYLAAGKSPKANSTNTLTWHFKVDSVHDFAWAADRDYQHDMVDGPNGMKIHFFYQKSEKFEQGWKDFQPDIVKLFEVMNDKFGQYPYGTYSIIQGGDGGMEYPLATLITGNRGASSLLGVSVHEVIHSWYQMLLGTNESLYSWMDEGFTTFAQEYVLSKLMNKDKPNLWNDSYNGYFFLVKSGSQEPLTTHADHYKSNRAYGIASYSMGAMFVAQLGYIMGDEAMYTTLKNYYNDWRFKHPTPNDFLKEAENVSGMVLDWYKEYWINTTNTIDYGITEVKENGKNTSVSLAKFGAMPMPLDVVVTLKSGKTINYNIPLDLMRGSKPKTAAYSEFVLLNDWNWVNPSYTFEMPIKMADVVKVEIDPSTRMADVNRENNSYTNPANAVKKD